MVFALNGGVTAFTALSDADFIDAVVFPEAAGAQAVTNVVEGGVRSIEQVSGDLEIVEIEVSPDAPAAGKTLESVRLPCGSLIIAAADGGHIGGPETVLEAGRTTSSRSKPTWPTKS